MIAGSASYCSLWYSGATAAVLRWQRIGNYLDTQAAADSRICRQIFVHRKKFGLLPILYTKKSAEKIQHCQ